MKIKIEQARFDALQIKVGSAITHEVYRALKKAGAPDGEALEQIVADAVFHIGCVLDGSAEITGPDGPMQVVLTFRRDQKDETLISAGGTSWIHEYASGIAEEYFDGVGARPTRHARPPARREDRPPKPLAAVLRAVREIVEAFTKP